MKRLFNVLVAVLFTAYIFAQTPQKMSFQLVVRNSIGTLVQNSNVGIRIIILSDSINGTVVYKEIYNPNPQTNANGLVSIVIGSGIPITGTFSSINWGNTTYFVKTETDPTGGTNYSISGVSQLLSVPYALFAKTSENSYLGNMNNLNIGDILYWNGTQWLAIPVGYPGQFLQLSLLNIPTWCGATFATLITTAISSITGTTAITGGNFQSRP